MKKLVWLLSALVLLSGCGNLEQAPATVTPMITETATPTATVMHTPTPTITPTATITPTPSPTPRPDVLLESADLAYHNGDWENAQRQYEQLSNQPSLSPEQQLAASLGLGQTYLAQGQTERALGILSALDSSELSPDVQIRTAIMIGDAYMTRGDYLQAAEAYTHVADLMPDLALYAHFWVGDAYYAAGNFEQAIPSFELALTQATSASNIVGLYERIGLSYAALGEYEPAMAAYDAILDIAKFSEYRSRIEYQAAQTALLFGEYDEGYNRMLGLIASYPDEDYAYEALVDLVEAGITVDNWLRGYIDYQAGAYGPAVQALYNAINEDPQHTGAPHYYLGLSYLEAGSPALAQGALQILIDTHPDDPYWNEAWLSLAEAQVEAGDTFGALETYRTFVDDNPQDTLAATALWQAATLQSDLGNYAEAAQLFTELADTYPDDEGAPEARFKAGLLLYQNDSFYDATEAWQAVTAWYPYDDRAQAAWFWMGKTYLSTGEVISATDALNAAVQFNNWSFYGLRAADLLVEVDPFATTPDINWVCNSLEEQTQAESWLADWLNLESVNNLSLLPAYIQQDPHLIKGSILLQSGHFDDGWAELEALRVAYADNALVQYQLAHTFRDLGLYRSSIIAATTLWNLSPADDIAALPRYIGCLIYPTYYSDLLLPEAKRTELDPLFTFALLRQESLFEGYATSYAAAHGLMQVIPPTGEEIATALQWPPDYETSDLYRPMVSVRFGIWYLTQQRDALDGELFAAMAAYNGGPGNAAYWWQLAEYDRDMFVELIGFYETRTYVRRIKEHYAKYLWLYGMQ